MGQCCSFQNYLGSGSLLVKVRTSGKRQFGVLVEAAGIPRIKLAAVVICGVVLSHIMSDLITADLTAASTPEEALGVFRPALIKVHEVLESLPPDVQEIFEHHELKHSGWIIAHLNRCMAFSRLNGSMVGDRKIVMNSIMNDGLGFAWGKYNVHVLKNSRLPTSASAHAFEQGNLAIWNGSSIPPLEQVVVFWQQNGKGVQLSLGAKKTMKKWNGECYWMIDVPHPAEWNLPTAEPATEEDDLHNVALRITAKEIAGSE
jgi:hypothetical protein